MRWLVPTARTILVLAILVVAFRMRVAPTLEAARLDTRGRDYASYHYAARVAANGDNPWERHNLGQLARADGGRRGVVPFLYPPPFLLVMGWSQNVTLQEGYVAMFWVNVAGACATALVLFAWLGAPPELLAGMLLTMAPLAETARNGQVNLPLTLLLATALWLGRGEILGAAAVMKIYPGIFLVLFALRRRLLAVLAAIATAAVLSWLALRIVPFEHQRFYYTEVLPAFWGGTSHSLGLDLNAASNHSLADLFGVLFPSADPRALSAPARALSAATSVALTVIIWLVGRRRRDRLGEACLAGALTVVMVLTPTMAWSDYFVALMIPVAALGAALFQRRIGLGWALPALAAYGVIATARTTLRDFSERHPGWESWIEESKPLAALAIYALCLFAASRSPLHSLRPTTSYSSLWFPSVSDTRKRNV